MKKLYLDTMFGNSIEFIPNEHDIDIITKTPLRSVTHLTTLSIPEIIELRDFLNEFLEAK